MNPLKFIFAGRGVLALGGVLLTGLVVLGIGLTLRAAEVRSMPLSSAEVVRQNLDLRILERGVLAPARVEPIKSGISSNQAQLVWILVEGSEVKKGQIIARFDTKPFNDRMQRAEQDVADLQATMIATQKVLAMKEVALDAQIEAARRKLDIALLKQDDLLNGSGPLKLRSLEQGIVQTERSMSVIRTEFDDMELLLEKGHISLRERERVGNELLMATEKLAMARAELENFNRFEWPQLVHEARLLVDAARQELDREQMTGELELQRVQGEIVKLQRDLAKAESRLIDARHEVSSCDVRAPIDGFLLHKELPRESGRRKVQIGDAIWDGQTFMEIPDTSEMVVEVQVREIDVAKLRKGARAEVVLDALAGKVFHGEVDYIDALARDESELGMRSFRTRILLKESASGLYPGMSASVRIVYRELQDVLVVPDEAIAYRDGAAFIRLRKGGGEQRVPVELGDSGAGKTVVLRGIEEGNHVLLGGF